MKLITYDTEFTFTHHLADGEWIVDKACLESHSHDAKLHLEFIVEEMTYDFKIIKQAVEGVLDSYRQKNITELYQIFTTEDFVDELEARINNATPLTVYKIHFQETKKYGVTNVSNS